MDDVLNDDIFIVISRELFALQRDISFGDRSNLGQHTTTFINIRECICPSFCFSIILGNND